jgi:PKD repeat protein
VSDTVIINYLQPATLADAGIDFQVCTPTATLGGNIPTVGNGSWLLLSGTGNIVNPTSPNATVQNIGSGVNVFRWYITNGTCYSSYDEVTVIRTLPPSTANAGLDYTTCNTVEIMNGNTPAIGVGHWNVVYGAVTLVNPQQPAAQVTGISLGDSLALAWTISNGGCISADTIYINTTLPATANFTKNVSGVTVQFTNQSTEAFAYNWSFGDGNFSTQKDPSHTYLSYGTFAVRMIAFNTCKNDTSYQTITIGTVSAEEELNKAKLELYPNPVQNLLYFRMPEGTHEIQALEIIDIQGRTIPTSFTPESNGSFSIETQGLPLGYYLLKVQTENGLFQGKFIKN